VAPGDADAVKIVEAEAELGLNQGVRGGVQLTRHAVRLHDMDIDKKKDRIKNNEIMMV
jgi:hypothetical protein